MGISGNNRAAIANLCPGIDLDRLTAAWAIWEDDTLRPPHELANVPAAKRKKLLNKVGDLATDLRIAISKLDFESTDLLLDVGLMEIYRQLGLLSSLAVGNANALDGQDSRHDQSPMTMLILRTAEIIESAGGDASTRKSGVLLAILERICGHNAPSRTAVIDALKTRFVG